MIRGFTFERALSWPFTAPHAATFPFIFGLAYAVAAMAIFAGVGLLSFSSMQEWYTLMQSLENETDDAIVFSALMSGFGMIIPWALLMSVLFWVMWAMFETASQRRYIWGEGFSLRLGADELRIMVVGLLWWLLGMVIVFLPVLLIMGSTFWALFASMANPELVNSPEFANRMAMQVFGIFGLMLLIMPVYVFFATRLSPSFGLTVMSRRIRFLDAWNVSRGRFWPILGAYVILAIGGGIIGQVVTGVAQGLMMPAFMRMANTAETGGDPAAFMFTADFLVPVGIFYFLVLFVQGILQHIVGGPAAFAARHDPAGGVEEAARVDAFV